MEQLRFWDLVRTGRYFDAIRNSYQNLQNPEDTDFANRIAEAALERSITSGVENPIPLFPLPAIDVEDWGIAQNPGY